MMSSTVSSTDNLIEEITRYLDCVDVFRKEGCDPFLLAPAPARCEQCDKAMIDLFGRPHMCVPWFL